jgi:hypothetical protein
MSHGAEKRTQPPTRSGFEQVKRWLPALPRPHFMGLAPLDVWWRMLARGGAWKRVSPRYWLRLAWCVATSALGTALTLPERAAVGAWLKLRGARSAGEAAPVKVLCILGYYRSGTTHLHYVLSCDRAMTTPRWYQVLAPQGWVLSWLFLRWFLVPFLGSTRPQDDVAIGPEWPAEDDFALCNWTLSSTLPGRMVLPREWESTWRGLHDFSGSEVERARFRRAVRAFAWKIARLDGGRRVILKTPAHTARVRLLLEAFGPEHVKFVHIARDPASVVKSNVAMHGRFEPYLLQDAADEADVRRRVIEEYDATERRFLDDAAAVPAGSLARVRYQDLIADPMGELRRVYAELGLDWSRELESRFAAYLRSVADYRAGTKRAERRSPDAASKPPHPSAVAGEEQLAWMHEAFGHARPAVERRDLPPDGTVSAAPASRLGLAADTAIPMMLWCTAWLGVAWVLRDRLDWMTWPAGVIAGVATRRIAGRGSAGLGAWAAALTVAAYAVVAYPATCLAFYADRSPMPWGDVWDSTRDGLLAINNAVWVFLGVGTAWRIGSRKHAGEPGEQAAGARH